VKSTHHRLAIRRAGAVRRLCDSRLQVLAQTITARDFAVDLDVVSFSNHGCLPEQLMSIRSFLREAGAPAGWTVVSDDTHTRATGEPANRATSVPCEDVARVLTHALRPVDRRR
jgi:hypothetical protein